MFTLDLAKSREGLKGTGAVCWGCGRSAVVSPVARVVAGCAETASSSSSDKTYSSSSSPSSSSFGEASPSPSSATTELSRDPDTPAEAPGSPPLYAFTSAAALFKIASSNVFNRLHRFNTRRTPVTCSGGHFSAASMQVTISGANLVWYNCFVSRSVSCVTKVLITYNTGTLCLGCLD